MAIFGEQIELTEQEKQLIHNEGLRLKAYLCTEGKITIGVGRNLEDKGVTEAEALFLLRNDIDECVNDLEKIFENFSGLDSDRRMVLVDMRFNLGPRKFRKFKRMIRAVNQRDFDRAAEEMKNSKWYAQVGVRSKRLCKMMKGQSQ
jgi:lysozyme